MKWEGMAGEAEGDGMDKEGLRLDVPEVSAARIMDRSAEIGGPGRRLELEHLNRDLTSI